MIEKCTKFESLFVFGSEEDLKEHLKVCPDCQQEYEQMEDISNIVKEVKPFIKRGISHNRIALKVAAGLTIIFLSFWVFQTTYFTNKSSNSALAMVKNESPAAQMNLPTDEYGLLVVEN
jgi:hypothetical protein